MEKSSRKKASNVVRVFLPVFIGEVERASNVTLNFEEIKTGVALYGDTAKRIGLKSALKWAEKKRQSMRVVDIVLDMDNQCALGAVRLDSDELKSGKYGILRLERHAVKKKLSEELSEIIEAAAGEKYPRVKQRSSEEWLRFDPSVARVLFDHFKLKLIIVNAHPYYALKSDALPVAVIRDASCITSASMLYEPVKVIIS